MRSIWYTFIGITSYSCAWGLELLFSGKDTKFDLLNFIPSLQSHTASANTFEDRWSCVSLSLFITLRTPILSPFTLNWDEVNKLFVQLSVSVKPWSKEDDNGFQWWGRSHHHPAKQFPAWKVTSFSEIFLFPILSFSSLLICCFLLNNKIICTTSFCCQYYRGFIYLICSVCLFVCLFAWLLSFFHPFLEGKNPSDFSIQAAGGGRPEGGRPCRWEGGRPSPHHLPHWQGWLPPPPPHWQGWLPPPLPHWQGWLALPSPHWRGQFPPNFQSWLAPPHWQTDKLPQC